MKTQNINLDSLDQLINKALSLKSELANLKKQYNELSTEKDLLIKSKEILESGYKKEINLQKEMFNQKISDLISARESSEVKLLETYSNKISKLEHSFNSKEESLLLELETLTNLNNAMLIRIKGAEQ